MGTKILAFKEEFICQWSLWKYGTKGSRVLCNKRYIFTMILSQEMKGNKYTKILWTNKEEPISIRQHIKKERNEPMRFGQHIKLKGMDKIKSLYLFSFSPRRESMTAQQKQSWLPTSKQEFCMVLFMMSCFIASFPRRIMRTFSKFREQSAKHFYTRIFHFHELANFSLPLFPLGACVYYNSKGLLPSINTRACKNKRHWVITYKFTYLIFNTSKTLKRLFDRVHQAKIQNQLFLIEFFTKAKVL